MKQYIPIVKCEMCGATFPRNKRPIDEELLKYFYENGLGLEMQERVSACELHACPVIGQIGVLRIVGFSLVEEKE